MTLQEAQLIKRTAWANIERAKRGATKEEARRLNPYVVNVVVYTAVLNGMLYDLKSAIKAEKIRPCGERDVLRRLHNAANSAHEEIYREFSNAIEGFAELYNRRYDMVTEAIEKRVLLAGGERYYNIVLALLRLIETNNNACGRFRNPTLVALKQHLSRLLAIPLPYEDKGDVMKVIIHGASKEALDAERFNRLYR